ncbi:Protein prenyltransferase [Metarhizium album ARSEF 1941]|uniref:Protein farnesyltransferase/geranylgeranyltransferase type-1 subunit alpha n=1 Tax=Metarhizium album (strain ARSEF 1941) TaxID=1081103 RepID=A0A0B2WNN4_METAS|nr:Protein prenyltransferase [Metarhizium album ARSEF 1941]KHN95598.1 Protein prenyltransferase [Metarhizium album ARSEF 1941]
MPPKARVVTKASNPESKAPELNPETLNDRTCQRYYQTNPVQRRFEEAGFPGLTPAERKVFIYSNLIQPIADHKISLSNKTERDYWKQVTKDGLPIRRLRQGHCWGKDKTGRDIGTYQLENFERRSVKQARLASLDILHHQFLAKRRKAIARGRDVSNEELDEEKTRRKDMATLNKDLYGHSAGSMSNNPEWDDVIPIPYSEPDDALAKIAYPDDYAEATSYLRAVMAADECSPRCLRLTEHVISMNPAHYTVWLYRFKIIQTLNLPVPEEIEWLNQVALENLKNYQIWHHRQLLLDYYFPSIDGDEETIKNLARTETQFINSMLEEDTKNYHVWSFRQYLVRKLGMWNVAELAATQNLIEDDVRIFLVFSNSVATPNLPATAHDPKVPGSLIDREMDYAKEKIALAPQNQSSWNYLRGVLAKGGRDLSGVREFSEQFISNLGADGEDVKSSHALDILVDIYRQAGNISKARLCLQRLWEKWDPVREGYWKFRASELGEAIE